MSLWPTPRGKHIARKTFLALEEELLSTCEENDQRDQCHPVCCFEILDQHLELGVKRSFLSDYLSNQISPTPAFAAEEFEEELAPEPPVQAARLNAALSATAVRKVRDLRIVFSFEETTLRTLRVYESHVERKVSFPLFP